MWETSGRQPDNRTTSEATGKQHLVPNHASEPTGRPDLEETWKACRQQGEKPWRKVGNSIQKTRFARRSRDNWETTSGREVEDI